MARYSFNRKTRTKKIRSPIKVKERIATKGGRCAGCRGRYEKGDEVTAVIVKRRTYHRSTCVPANAGQMATPGVPGPAQPPASVTPGEAKLRALMELESCLKVLSRTMVVTDELDKTWQRYNKVKGHALRPSNDQEGKQGMLLAIQALVKLVFGS
jgi:hypothetical protein